MTILNFKFFNDEWYIKKILMESMRYVIHMIKQEMFLASLDIKYKVHSAPIYKEHRKFLKF